jgi:hypothetical protein
VTECWTTGDERWTAKWTVLSMKECWKQFGFSPWIEFIS